MAVFTALFVLGAIVAMAIGVPSVLGVRPYAGPAWWLAFGIVAALLSRLALRCFRDRALRQMRFAPE